MRSLPPSVVIVATLAAAAPASAGWRLPFEVVGPDQGLPSGQALTLAQAPDGFLWIGSENGVLRYEGGRARPYSRAEGLPSAYVHRLVTTPDGAVWAATARGLARVKDGVVAVARLDGEPPEASISFLELDGGGRVWAATRTAIFSLTGELTLRRHPWTGAPVTALTAGAGGAVYAAGPGLVRRFAPDGTTTDLAPGPAVPAEGARLLAEDPLGRLWAGAGKTLAVMRPGGRFEDRSGILPGALVPNGVAFHDRDGALWFPTGRGALRVLGEETSVLGAAAGLPFSWVRTVFRDREGTLWIAGPTLARLQGEGRLRSLAPAASPQGAVVWAVRRAPGGRLLVGSDEGAAWLDGEVERRIPGTEGRRIKSVAVDRAGRAWLVSSTGAALWLEPGAARAVPAPLGEHGFQLNAVLVDSKGTVWVCHALEGILRFDPVSRTLVHEGPPELRVPGRATQALGVSEDVAGRLWFGTSEGLVVRERDGGWRTYGTDDGLPLRRVRGVAPLPDAGAWIFFEEPMGLVHVQLGEGRLEVLGRRGRAEGLASDQIYAAAADATGRLWYATEQGFGRITPALHVGRQQGMVNEDCSLHGILLEGETVWVGTSGGLVRFDASASDLAVGPPAAHVLEATLGDARLLPPFRAASTIGPDHPTAELRFGAPAYALDHSLRFQVRMTGLEEAWREAGGTLVRYTGLAPGPHRFEVRATYDGLRFGPVGAIEFQVLPAWWQTWWARGGLGVAFVLLVAAIVQLRLAALRRAKLALEALVEQRTAELRDRNQELSTALSEVRELSGLLPICMHCKRIRDDHGYWEKIEKYVSARTRASFTHGLCPDCLPRYMPPDDELRAPPGDGKPRPG